MRTRGFVPPSSRRRTAAAALVALAVAALTACQAAPSDEPTARPVADSATPPAPSPVESPSSPAPSATTPWTGPIPPEDLLACTMVTSKNESGFFTSFELPDGRTVRTAGYEGWWNSTPSREDGSVAQPHEWSGVDMLHPKVALVLAGTGDLIASYDRTTCGPVEELPPLDLGGLPPESVAIVDALTGEVLSSFMLEAS